jgi:exosortase E/protease (VPEID-CTERM system)
VITDNTRTTRLDRLLPHHLVGRLYLIAGILSLELMVRWPVVAHPDVAQALTVPAIVAYALFLGLGYSRIKEIKDNLPFGWALFCAHAVCYAAFVAGTLTVLRDTAPPVPFFLFGLGCVHLAAVVLLMLACVPLRAWVEMVRRTGTLGLWACAAALVAWLPRTPEQHLLWKWPEYWPVRWLQGVTYGMVRAVLERWLPNVTGDVSNFTIGSGQFIAQVNDSCSGVEGLGLVLVFTVTWLVFFRREVRFPQALVLVPVALGAMWSLNVLRIAAMVVVGVRWGGEAAVYGFHSEAGWIAFTAVALGFSLAMLRVPWMRRDGARPEVAGAGNDVAGAATGRVGGADLVGEAAATPAYLVPFLAIIAASYISRLAGGSAGTGFEALYGLRFVAAGLALWVFRGELRKLDWRFGWMGPAVGAAVFAVWVAPEMWRNGPGASGLGVALAALPAWERLGWLAVRVTAAVVTVPIAEELAFRGYLARRLMDREFDQVAFAALRAVPIAVSSLAFGSMHGAQWQVGIVAGVAYALVVKRTGRFGDAVAAHATSNLLLAVWVLSRGDWGMW